ncbi:cell division protein ZapD [Colwellia sp. MB02u-10]|jgi:cell division protein ZapD|uniref:cell division protein ZapD n=1 Tax=Colwellia sp. MB02u-10 TaxID=2759828 RepID=UPI0015F3D61D|nr:cell division protein ZapD [Colwellia sp. MB02u-10]MBA6342347.1 cell division protein ZapD [Colwellia sp. MB02u-10]
MTAILYEHPLNERIRNYLKLEQLFFQASDCLQYNMATSYSVFFNALFAILDTVDRNDIRGDLIKDLEKIEQNLVVWSKIPDINSAALEDNLKKTLALSSQLKGPNPKWLQFKDDKFLVALKQRFAIQGGSSRFDLPQLQFWLSQPSVKVEAQCRHWLSLLAQISAALSLVLKFVRQRTQFKEVTTDSGFYQDNGEGLILLRIKIAEHLPFYPIISGNRFRYSIRFMTPCNESGRKYSKQTTHFQLARCK